MYGQGCSLMYLHISDKYFSLLFSFPPKLFFSTSSSNECYVFNMWGVLGYVRCWSLKAQRGEEREKGY